MIRYWRFYWPLALMGTGMVLSVQFQNATLARYPQAVTELAVLALAYGVYGFFNAGLQFISQLSNVYARSDRALKLTQRFVLLAAAGIALPLLLIALSPIGVSLIAVAFGVEHSLAVKVTDYLLWMWLLIPLNAQRHFLSGLLIQAQRTGWVTTLNFVYLGVVIIALICGLQWDLPPRDVIVGAELIGVSTFVVTLTVARALHYQLPEHPEHESVSYRELLGFFIPVSTTGVMFALSRPILFAMVARTPDGVLQIAALRVAFDFSMIFQQATNQFRHFFITFGFEDMRGKRRFMALVAIGLTAVMLIFAVTPLASWVWGDLMGLPAQLQTLSRQVLLVMCLMPTVIIYRNYFHSYLMQLRKTAGMAYGSMTRVAGIFLIAQLWFSLGWLNHITASATMIMGFAIEAVVAQMARQRATRETAAG